MARSFVPPNIRQGLANVAGVRPSGSRQKRNLFFTEQNTPGYTPEQAVHHKERQDLYNSDLLGYDYHGKKVNPFLTGGLHPSGRKMQTLLDLWEDQNNNEEDYYEPDVGSTYRNLGNLPSSSEDKTPAPITVVPTTTTNPQRPRTVAAGFQATDANGDGKLTVVFRDGTYYNYYKVPLQVWESFKMSPSKGRFIAANLDSYPRGAVDYNALDARVRAVVDRLYAISRVHQKLAYVKPTTKGVRASGTRYRYSASKARRYNASSPNAKRSTAHRYRKP